MSVKLGIDVELHQLSLVAPAGYFVGLHIRFTAPLFTFQTYDQRWLDYYTEKGYVLRDPMVAWGFSATGTIRWSDSALPDPFGLFNEAARYGLNYGATVACGPVKSRSIASFARADREFEDHEIAAIATIVHRLHDVTEPPEELTKAQIEALRCIAGGGPVYCCCGKTGYFRKCAESACHIGAGAAYGAYHSRGHSTCKGLSADLKTPSAMFRLPSEHNGDHHAHHHTVFCQPPQPWRAVREYASRAA